MYLHVITSIMHCAVVLISPVSQFSMKKLDPYIQISPYTVIYSRGYIIENQRYEKMIVMTSMIVNMHNECNCGNHDDVLK